MALINLMIVRYKKNGKKYSGIIGTHIRTVEGLLRKARRLIEKYSIDSIDSTRKAEVYIYDQKNDLKGIDPSLVFWTPQELYDEGGYEAIAKKVKEVQWIDLRI